MSGFNIGPLANTQVKDARQLFEDNFTELAKVLKINAKTKEVEGLIGAERYISTEEILSSTYSIVESDKLYSFINSCIVTLPDAAEITIQGKPIFIESTVYSKIVTSAGQYIKYAGQSIPSLVLRVEESIVLHPTEDGNWELTFLRETAKRAFTSETLTLGDVVSISPFAGPVVKATLARTKSISALLHIAGTVESIYGYALSETIGIVMKASGTHITIMNTDYTELASRYTGFSTVLKVIHYKNKVYALSSDGNIHYFEVSSITNKVNGASFYSYYTGGVVDFDIGRINGIPYLVVLYASGAIMYHNITTSTTDHTFMIDSAYTDGQKLISLEDDLVLVVCEDTAGSFRFYTVVGSTGTKTLRTTEVLTEAGYATPTLCKLYKYKNNVLMALTKKQTSTTTCHVKVFNVGIFDTRFGINVTVSEILLVPYDSETCITNLGILHRDYSKVQYMSGSGYAFDGLFTVTAFKTVVDATHSLIILWTGRYSDNSDNLKLGKSLVITGVPSTAEVTSIVQMEDYFLVYVSNYGTVKVSICELQEYYTVLETCGVGQITTLDKYGGEL